MSPRRAVHKRPFDLTFRLTIGWAFGGEPSLWGKL